MAYATDIGERGLLQPIVLDAAGRILDGRNRYAACEIAGVQPVFVTYDGGDADGYALAVNIARRHLSKGQIAMVAAQALLVSGSSQSAAADASGVSQQRISYARVVLDHAPDLADSVVSGAVSLDQAYDTARERKKAAATTEHRMERLRADAVAELPEADDEGTLTLDRIAKIIYDRTGTEWSTSWLSRYRATARAFPIGTRVPIASFNAHRELRAHPDKLTSWKPKKPGDVLTVEAAKALRGRSSARKPKPDAWRTEMRETYR